jgi:HK97 gp10 family phage protein
VTFKIEGARAMEDLLKQLGPRAARKLGTAAARAGLRPIAAEAKRLVPVRSGALKRAIVVVAGKPASETQRTAVLGFKPPESRRAHLTEFGTAHSAAHPFVRPALDGQKAQALEAMGQSLADGITREAEKLAGEIGTKR